MNKEDSKRKIFRIGLIFLVIMLLVLTGIQLFLSYYLDDYVENQLISIVSEQTQGQYELKMSALDLHVWGKDFQIDSLRLVPVDTSSAAPRIKMDQLSISGIQFLPYIFGGNIHTGQVLFSKPVVSITHNSPDSLIFLQPFDRTSHPSNKKTPTIEVGSFQIDDGTFLSLNQEQSDSLGEIHNFNLEIADILLDSTTLVNAPYFNYSAIQTKSGKIRYQLSDLYALESNGIELISSGGFFSIDSLNLVPQYPKYEFTEQVGHQLDRISLTVGRLMFEGTNFERLNSGELLAKKLTVEHANLDVFHSKLLPSAPGGPKVKTFPQIAFKRLHLPISIDTIRINQSEISYSEHLPDISRPGKVTFANVNATFSDVTNDSSRISQGHTIMLDVTSEVMGEALLTAQFEFPMHLDESHWVRGNLESMQAENLNPILEPVGMVRARSGTIHSLDFLMDLGADKATGWVQLQYSDLRIEVLNSNNVDDGGRNRLKTFLANILKIKRNNNEEPFRRGEVLLERDEHKSIFSYWWKSLSTGLKDNVGI